MHIDYEYLCENLSHLSGLPVRIYRQDTCIQHCSNVAFEPDPVLTVWERIHQSSHNVSYYDMHSFLFAGAIKVMEDNITIVVGPTSHIKLGDAQLTTLLRQLGEPQARLEQLRAYFASMPNYPLENFLNILCFVNFSLNDEKLTVRDLIEQDTSYLRPTMMKKKANINMPIQEAEAVHNTLEMEKKLFSLITAGQTSVLAELFDQPPTGRVGKIAHSDMRQRKNTFIIAAALASRAAIAGGMPQDDAFSLSDLYIQKAELITQYNQLTMLNMEMLLDFARKVERLHCHGSRTRLVIEVAQYIARNIQNKITSADIAAYMKMNRTHLCERFRQETGITVGKFVTELKITEAKRLLSTTSQSVLQISEYLGYSSQGYFQNVFKKEVGCTPKEFRNTEAKI